MAGNRCALLLFWLEQPNRILDRVQTDKISYSGPPRELDTGLQAGTSLSLMQSLSCLSMNVCPRPILQRILRMSTALLNQTLRNGDDWVGGAGDASADTSIDCHSIMAKRL